jgi:Sugar (and other) transporter
MVPTIIGFFLMLDLPDTPRWYYYVGRMEEGDTALCRIYNRPLTDPSVSASKLSILTAIELEKNAPKLRLSDFFWDQSDYKVVRRLTICFGILSFQQLMGQKFRK